MKWSRIEKKLRMGHQTKYLPKCVIADQLFNHADTGLPDTLLNPCV